jgi:hypothetical protein
MSAVRTLSLNRTTQVWWLQRYRAGRRLQSKRLRSRDEVIRLHVIRRLQLGTSGRALGPWRALQSNGPQSQGEVLAGAKVHLRSMASTPAGADAALAPHLAAGRRRLEQDQGSCQEAVAALQLALAASQVALVASEVALVVAQEEVAAMHTAVDKDQKDQYQAHAFVADGGAPWAEMAGGPRVVISAGTRRGGVMDFDGGGMWRFLVGLAQGTLPSNPNQIIPRNIFLNLYGRC